MKNNEDKLIDLCIAIHTHIEEGRIGYATQIVKDYCQAQTRTMKERMYLAEDKAKEQYQQKWDIIEGIDEEIRQAQIAENKLIHDNMLGCPIEFVEFIHARLAKLQGENDE